MSSDGRLPQGKVLHACTRDHLLAQRSGYHLIAEYVPGSLQIFTPRREPTQPLRLFAIRLLRRLAFTRWYSGGSFAMERQIWQYTHARRDHDQASPSPVHLLWCDRDLGFLDHFLDLRRHPLIGTFHQCVDELPRIIRRPSALRKFASIILMSETQRPYFLAHGVPSERLHCILHGVDTAHFTPAVEPPPHEAVSRPFTALSVGGTRRDFPALRDIAAQSPALHFQIVGPTDRKHLFEGMANVTYQSGISDSALLAHYRSASCYLHLAEAATANNSLLEALACGLPVITQRVGGIPEYVTPACAIVTAPESQSAVITSLHDLATSPARQTAMRHAARDHALTLDWHQVARRTHRLYTQEESLN